MSQPISRWIIASSLASFIGISAHAATQQQTDQAIGRLRTEFAGAEVSTNPATGMARFVRVAPATLVQLDDAAPQQVTREAEASLDLAAASFLARYGAAFGLRGSAGELALRKSEADDVGQKHLTYEQRYQGLPVFGSTLKVHFDAGNRITVVNGTVVPDINVSTVASRSKQDAEIAAIKYLKAKGGVARNTRLLIYREGLVKGVPGDNRLAYEVEVISRNNVRDFVYVDAQTGKPIDRISGTPDALNRIAFDAHGLTAPGPDFPSSPFWVEGQAFPTGLQEADNMIEVSKETYDLYKHAFNRDSFDGAGGQMISIFNRGNACPNASWNGTFISFCPGLTTDDVTGHEWSHAYTQYTDNLVYAWQSGALNEANSDIFGEIVDRLNLSDAVGTNGPRSSGGGVCTVYTALPAVLTFNSPASIAGQKLVGTASFGAQIFNITNDVVLVDDGDSTAGGATTDGCQTPFVNASAVSGKIAFIDRGVCGFSVKAKNAEDNGAIGVIIGNNQGGTIVSNMGPTVGFDPTIPSLMVTQNDAGSIKAELASTTVNATMQRELGTDNSARWLLGEDSTAPGLTGALRDMWEPNCYGNPNRVSDPLYTCSAADGGGVHTNSGVDNRAFSLVVDGGTHNGVTVGPIGLTKAANIWFRSKLAYQNPVTDFAEHADALEQSCKDLIGKNLKSLSTGKPSGEKISRGDCNNLKKAMQATEMRTPPTQCGFPPPLLAQNAPSVCPPSTKSPKKVFADNFEKPAASRKLWTVSNAGTTPDFTARNWAIVGKLPDNKKGKAYFGADPNIGTCAPGGDETAVLHLDGPAIQLPASGNVARVSFDHWVSTEAGWDGGNVKISVNGGAYTLIPDAAFIYNPYNASLFTGGQGNSNPIAGQRAFTGADPGSTGGTWGTSIIDLTGIAAPGDIVRLRFDIGNDACGGALGWYLDNLKIQQCR